MGIPNTLRLHLSLSPFNAAIAYFKGPGCDVRHLEAHYATFAQIYLTWQWELLEVVWWEPTQSSVCKLSMTLISGALEIVSKIISHSTIQGGPSFPYLSPAMYWFIFVTGSLDSARQHAAVNDIE